MSQSVPHFNAEELLEILSLSENATAIYATENLVIQSANAAMMKIWHTQPDIIGLPLEEALPEIKNQPFMTILQTVWRTGIVYTTNSAPTHFYVDGKLQTFYLSATCRPIKNETGEVYCILHTTADVTSQVSGYEATRRAAEQDEALQREQILNEELTVVNEELTASNEELQQAQQSLATLNNELEERIADRVKDLAESEAKFRNMVQQSPIPMLVTRGEFMTFDIINKPMLQLIGKDESVRGKPWYEAIPELNGQPILDQLYYTYRTGKEWTGFEQPVMLMKGGRQVQGYYNISNKPLIENGEVVGVLQSAVDITEQLAARKKTEQLYEQSRLSKEAADLGLFDMDLPNGTMDWDVRCRELFGINHNNPVTYEKDFLPGLHPEDRERISHVVNSVFDKSKTNGDYDVEYRTVGAKDGRIRWVRAKGKVMFDERDKPIRFIGSVLDVTEQVTARQQLETIIVEKTSLENSLRENQNRLQSILDTMAEGVAIIDTSGKAIYANQMAQTIFGLTESEIKERTYNDSKWKNLNIDGSLLRDEDHPMAIMKATGKPVYDHEIAVEQPGKERIYVSINAAPLFDPEGTLTGGVGTFMDVTTRRKDIQQKDDFISIASHELKTPVTSLKASLQLLDRMKDNPSPVLLPKLVEQSNKSVTKVINLIDELLNASQVTQGFLQLNKSLFSIADMINGCCDHVRMAGIHELILEGDKQLQIYADEHRIDQVMVNLVNNSVKYAPDSKEIYIMIEKLDTMARVSVRDTGPGIEPEKLPHLFERYYRVSTSGSKYGGLGLGLYISSEIIKKHGGKIGVESELGKGTTFWFTLPL